MVKPPQNQFLNKISSMIDEKRNEHHKYALLSSGTAHRINQELANQQPLETRMDFMRALNHDWLNGNQKLNGLIGVLKEYALEYKSGSFEAVEKIMLSEIHSLNIYSINFIIVPKDTVEDFKRKYPSTNFISEQQCLRID